MIVWLTLSLALVACKDDKDLDDIPAPSPEQIEKAKKKAAERKKAKGDKAKGDKAKGDKAKAKKKAADKKKAGDGKSGKSTIEKRREERKKRLAELKKRNEKRRKERLEKLRNSRDMGKGTKKASTPPIEPMAGATPKKTKPDATKTAVPARAATKARKKAPVPKPQPRASTPVAPATPLNALDISRFINLIEIRTITGKSDLRASGALVGIPISTRYNSALFLTAKDEFGVAVQVWKDVSRRKGVERFQAMKASYTEAQDTDAVTNKGFFSAFGDLMTLVFFEPFKRTLVAVTCSSKVCSQESLLKLAQRAKAQI